MKTINFYRRGAVLPHATITSDNPTKTLEKFGYRYSTGNTWVHKKDLTNYAVILTGHRGTPLPSILNNLSDLLKVVRKSIHPESSIVMEENPDGSLKLFCGGSWYDVVCTNKDLFIGSLVVDRSLWQELGYTEA